MMRMSDLKELQSKVRTEVYQRWGKIDYDSTIDGITESLVPMRKAGMTDNDFVQMVTETIDKTYDCSGWYDSTKIIEPCMSL